MIKEYIKKDFNNFSKSMKANYNALFEPIRVSIVGILDWVWMMVKVLIVIFGIVCVIGLVQKPGKDASTEYTLQSNHEEMIRDNL